MGNRKKERHYTIMPTDRNYCYQCGFPLGTYSEFHHCIHGTANRAVADREGLGVYVHPKCHRLIHSDKTADLLIERDAQEVWETKYMKDNNATKEEARTAWRELFGKSYIYD